MSDYMESMFSTRIGGRNFGHEEVLYKFEKIKQAKREAALLNPMLPLIDFGVGAQLPAAFINPRDITLMTVGEGRELCRLLICLKKKLFWRIVELS